MQTNESPLVLNAIRVRTACWFTLILLISVFSLRLLCFSSRWFNPDEFEHLHAAWCSTKGYVLYKDVFEHHTPLFYLMLSPFVRNAGKDYDAAIHAIMLSRLLDLFLSAGALACVIWIGSLWSGLLSGLVAAVLLEGMPMFFDKTLEIRPDVPALLMWTCCLALLARILTRPKLKIRSTLACFSAGFCLGCGIMCTQKMLFALPGLGVGWLLGSVPYYSREMWTARLRAGLPFAGGLLVPFLSAWAWFAAHRASSYFLYNNFVLNAHWKAAEPRVPLLQWFFCESWPVVLFAWGGCIFWARDGLSKRSFDWIGAILITSLAGLLFGLMVIPVSYEQYFITFLPILALFGGRFVASLFMSFPRAIKLPFFCGSLLLLQLFSFIYEVIYQNVPNDEQLRDLKTVFAITSPNDRILDGWRGLGVFRPHTWYYYFIQPDVRGMLSAGEFSELMARLESGEHIPKVVAMDRNLRSLPERFQHFVSEHYRNVGSDLWVLATDQSEEARRYNRASSEAVHDR